MEVLMEAKPLGGEAIKGEGFHVVGAKAIYIIRCSWCWGVSLSECEVRNALVCDRCNRIVCPAESQEMLDHCYNGGGVTH